MLSSLFTLVEALVVLHTLPFVGAQLSNLPNTFPHDYPGKPSGDFGPSWQKYYEITSSFPNVSFPLTRGFAGNVPVNRPDHPNCTLYFWAYEKSNGSLTSNSTSDPWLVWLNGGPGASSLYGFFFENGPMQIQPDYKVTENKWSWTGLVDSFWVDQPVGTGWSTSDSKGYAEDEEMVARDFSGFLSNIVKIFPSLAKRPLYIIGESYAGVYIPYIAKELLSDSTPPVNLKGISIGNGAIGSFDVVQDSTAVQIIETWPQLIGYDQEVYKYFRQQEALCGMNFSITYPQKERIPLPPVQPGQFPDESVISRVSTADGRASIHSRLRTAIDFLMRVDEGGLKKRAHEFKKRSLQGRANGTVDPWYICFQLTMLHDYVMNFTAPWSTGGYLSYYNIPDAVFPQVLTDASVFLNDEKTRAAIHAPTSKDWAMVFNYPFSWANSTKYPFYDPSPVPSIFLGELFANTSKKGVHVSFYSGNDDFILAHRGTDVVLQNTTWGGIRGFSRQPSTPWTNDRGDYAGIVHQERNITYGLFKGAGHEVPRYQPENAFVFLREFVLGQNSTGALTQEQSVSNTEPVAEKFEHKIIEEVKAAVYTGASTTQGSTLWPSATVAAWESFIVTAATAPIAISTGGSGQTSSGSEVGRRVAQRNAMIAILILVLARGMYFL